jgi:hypothetical protein
MALEKTAVCTDGKAHYLVVAPSEPHLSRLFYGDDKVLHRLPPPPFGLDGLSFAEPREWSEHANPSFRGLDMRSFSSVEPHAGGCTVRCGARSSELAALAPEKARTFVLAAALGPLVQQHKPHALLRDARGVYFYVDTGFQKAQEKRFRLFRGQKGALKQLKMTNVVSDSEGEIFATRSGSLRLVLDRTHPPTWTEGGRTTELRAVPVGENLPLIYNELGVYQGERLGTPCDDM